MKQVVNVAGDGHVGNVFAGGGIENDEASGLSTADKEAVGGGVRKVRKVLAHLVRAAVENLQCAVVTVGDEYLIGLRQIKNACWLGHSRDAPDALAGSEIEHLKGVVAQSRDEKTVAFDINGEV